MIAIIAGCGANIASVQFALTRLGVQSELTLSPEVIQSASHVILPGVGTAQAAMSALKKNKLDQLIKSLKQPVLGICLGMQLLFEHSTEGGIDCLGVLPGTVAVLPKQQDLTRPHMGWNQLQLHAANNPLFKYINDGSYCYFVHGFVAPVNHTTLAITHYGKNFSAIVQHNNFYGMQFHPEKSGQVGAQLLRNFFYLN